MYVVHTSKWWELGWQGIWEDIFKFVQYISQYGLYISSGAQYMLDCAIR